MIESYKVVYQDGSEELVEKKSRFIADIRPVSGEEKAPTFVEEIRKKYWDARHRCFAYIIGDRGQTARHGNDGEPPQTTEKPMMDVLAGEGLHDVCVVVTKYFGETLLGTDGLVRAYSGAVKAGLEDCMIAEKKLAVRLEVATNYNGSREIQYIATQAGMDTLDVQYTDKAVFVLLVPVSEEGRFRSQITGGTNGRAHIEKVDEIYYGMGQGELIVFQRKMPVQPVFSVKSPCNLQIAMLYYKTVAVDVSQCIYN